MIWFLCGNTGKNANLLKIDLISSTNRIYTNLCTPLRYIRSILLDEFIEIVKPLAELSNSIKNFNTSMCMVLIRMSENTDQKREKKTSTANNTKAATKMEKNWHEKLCYAQRTIINRPVRAWISFAQKKRTKWTRNTHSHANITITWQTGQKRFAAFRCRLLHRRRRRRRNENWAQPTKEQPDHKIVFRL